VDTDVHLIVSETLLVWRVALWGPPIAGLTLITLAYTSLLWLIPLFTAKTSIRTDIHATRAAYVSAIVGVVCLAAWAIMVLLVGAAAELKQIGVFK